MIPSATSRTIRRLSTFSLAFLMLLMGSIVVRAQQTDAVNPTNQGGQDAILVDAAEIQSVMNDQPPVEESLPDAPTGIDLLALMMRGGAFMIPIGVMSLMVVALAFERMVNLRRQRILPRQLVRDLEELSEPLDQFDPPSAYDSCREFPSPASRVIAAMLLRTGQPLSEIERAATETIQREADKCAAPIRWLTLAAAATPLMGLLGTVWGMIVAFHESTTLTPDRSRSEQLSEGIYTALVTTLAGLVVAIPAAILALYLENRLAKLFHLVEELVFELSPGLARFAGQRRMDADGVLRPIEPMAPSVEGAKPPAPPRAPQTHGGAKAV